jgi:excisionase family DNA binding protein
MEDRWLSVEEIAGYLGLSKDTVYAWITTNRMPAHRVGRLWKFKKETVDAWLQSAGAEATRAAPQAAGDGPATEAPRRPSPGSKKLRTRTRGTRAR